MNSKTFDTLVVNQLARSENLLARKGQEYAESAENDAAIDRLAHFKKAAALQGGTTEQAAFGMLAKHLVSLADMVRSAKPYPLERWDEKISDSINYLLILRAIIEEEHEKRAIAVDAEKTME